MTPNEAERWRLAAIVGAIGLGLVVASVLLIGKVRGLTPDGSEYAEIARSLASGRGYLIHQIQFHLGFRTPVAHAPELHGILEPFLIAPLFWVAGPDAGWVAIPCVACAAATPVAITAMGVPGFSRRSATIAALLLLTSSEWQYFALLGADDVLLAFFSTLSFLFFLRANQDSLGVSNRPGPRFFVAALFAAGAILAKASGALVTVAELVALAATCSSAAVPRARWGRATIELLLPALVAVAMYPVRNYVSHGDLGFRFSGVDWLSARVDPEAYFAAYEKAPTVLGTWRALGALRVLQLIFGQVKELWGVIHGMPLLLLAGPVALALPRRLTGERRAAVITGAVYVVSNAAFLCVFHHIELRYLSSLFPTLAFALAAALDGIASHMRDVRVSRVLAVLVASVLLARGAILVSGFRELGVVNKAVRPACPDAVEFIRRSVPPDAPILTQNPWFVAWDLDHPAVVAPSNGAEPIVRAARYYRTNWALTGVALVSYRTVDLDRTFRDAGPLTTALRPERVFDGVSCDVYRLHLGSE